MKANRLWLLLFLALMGAYPFEVGGSSIPIHTNISRSGLVSITADPLDFGTRYIEYDPITMDITVTNMEYFPISITAIAFQNDASPFSTNATLPLSINTSHSVALIFNPLYPGNYRDSLFIYCENDTIPSVRIGLMGRCENIPPNAVDNLQIVISGNDANLSWDEVSTDMYGNPFAVDGYLVLYNERICNDPEDYFYLWETQNLNFTHPDVVLYSPRQFYQVLAYKLHDESERSTIRSLCGVRIKLSDLHKIIALEQSIIFMLEP